MFDKVTISIFVLFFSVYNLRIRLNSLHFVS